MISISETTTSVTATHITLVLNTKSDDILISKRENLLLHPFEHLLNGDQPQKSPREEKRCHTP